MNLAFKILRDKKGQTVSIEEFFYNESSKLVRQNFKDNNNNLKYYKTFEYYFDRNLCSEIKFSADNKSQGSHEYKYDDLGNQIQNVVRTVDGSIYEWYENFEVVEKKLKVYISKDTNGNIIHKTEENLLDHSQQRFNEKNQLYEIHKRKYDELNRIVEEIITNENGKEKTRSFYSYQSQHQKWTLFIDGELIKTEENVYDSNGNRLFYIRRDNKGIALEWNKFEYDKFNNLTKYSWGNKEGIEIDFKTFDLIYQMKK